jgi:hypothetical protein
MQEPGGQFVFDPFLSMPPRGTCTSYSMTGNILAIGFQLSSNGRALDLGTLSANSAGSSAPISTVQAGLYDSILASRLRRPCSSARERLRCRRPAARTAPHSACPSIPARIWPASMSFASLRLSAALPPASHGPLRPAYPPSFPAACTTSQPTPPYCSCAFLRRAPPVSACPISCWPTCLPRAAFQIKVTPDYSSAPCR